MRWMPGLALFLIVSLCMVPLNRSDADTIHFKNGSVLTNVKVLQEDWRGVRVQVSDTVMMSFLRQDIDKIDREGRREPIATEKKPEYSGERLPMDMNKKLARNIEVNYDEPTSFLEILDNISLLYEIPIKVDQKVRDKIGTEIDPMWTFKKSDGRTVSDMLQKLCQDKKLQYKVSDGSMVITLPEPAAAPTPTAQ